MADGLGDRLRHAFRQPALLRQALTHRSFGTPHNERLEFIGDAVLNCVVALILYETFPNVPEGHLTRARAKVVSRDALARVAREMSLGKDLLRGKSVTEGSRQDWMEADALEAVIGAIFVDGGFAAARTFVENNFAGLLRDADPGTLDKDAKTQLQEWLQARKLAVPEYAVVATAGEAHAQQFTVECRIPALTLVTQGSGGSRRVAEQEAAAAAYAQIARGNPRE